MPVMHLCVFACVCVCVCVRVRVCVVNLGVCVEREREKEREKEKERERERELGAHKRHVTCVRVINAGFLHSVHVFINY